MRAALDRGMGSFHRHPAEIAPASFGDAPGDVQVTAQAYPCAQSREYPETAAGKTHTFTARNVRYVRDWLNGSTVNVYNHWVEIEVWGTATTAYIGKYFEWTGSSSTMVRYYYAGSTRVAMRVGNGTGVTGLTWLLADHLGSTSLTADASGNKATELRFKPWGEKRYAWGTTLTTFRYTGQKQDSYINLYWFGSRWYDDALGRFVQPDSIVPGVGEDGNPNAVGYLGSSTYSPLIVDYHENQFLDQLNTENRTKLQDPDFRLPSVPINSIAFDRYAYSLNNPIRYVDPNGHFAILAALALITPIGWLAIGITAVGAGLYFAVPGVREAVTYGMCQVGEAASNELYALFAKGEYVPRGLSGAERNAYREAVHAYKRAWGLGPKDNVPKEILDDIADAIKEGLKPGDAADAVDGPPEADSGD